nr:MAG TPA: hypothetical protein [Crassvirales sp.]
MNETISKEVLIAKFWLEVTSEGLGNAWNDDFEEFKDQYYGCFKTLEDYAQYIIEQWDRSNFIPFQLSGRIKPSDLLLDEYYMSEVSVFKGPSQDNPEEEMVYIFHTQEYAGRLDN